MNKSLYEKYHKNVKPHKRIILPKNFTYRNIIKILNKYIPELETVLDIGSATGTIAFFLANKGLNVDGIELSKNAVKFANLNNKKFGFKNVKFYNTSIEKYKTTKKYDLILCLEVLEHIDNDHSALKNIVKLMDNNSYLILTVPSANAPLYQLGLLKRFDREVGHLRRYSLPSAIHLLNKAGLKIEHKYKAEGLFRSIIFTNKVANVLVKFARFKFINDMFTYFDKYTLKFFNESQLIFICRKK